LGGIPSRLSLFGSQSAPNIDMSTSSEKQDAAVTALEQGLMNLITPVVRECDESIQSVYKTQEELSKQIDCLTEELETFLSVTQTPSLSVYIQKLANTKSRITSLNFNLSRINDRLDRIHASLLSSPSEPISKASFVNVSSTTPSISTSVSQKKGEL
jgi:seryl-tRNA synthetase